MNPCYSLKPVPWPFPFEKLPLHRDILKRENPQSIIIFLTITVANNMFSVNSLAQVTKKKRREKRCQKEVHHENTKRIYMPHKRKHNPSNCVNLEFHASYSLSKPKTRIVALVCPQLGLSWFMDMKWKPCFVRAVGSRWGGREGMWKWGEYTLPCIVF